MFEIDINKPIRVHFIGIGGVSMSGLAQILVRRGFDVSGSDSHSSEYTEKLKELGVKLYLGQRAANITDDITVVVYTAAIHKDNEEFAAAVSKNIPMLTRAEMWGQVMKNYGTAVAVSGTHGKTTTTSMITELLVEADLNPTVTVGGILPSIGGNLRIGSDDIFVTEACEYSNSFLSFYPTIGIILNIEEDHLDFFKGLDDIRHSFMLFAQKLPETGSLIINGSIENIDYFTKDLSCSIITFGFDSSYNYCAKNISYHDNGCCSYDLYKNQQYVETITLSVYGKHNVLDSLAAIATCDLLTVDFKLIADGLKGFHGSKRRFEFKGELGGIKLFDDYAHHPTEISATLEAANNYPHRKLIVVFQPHTYTRTKAFLTDFAKSLSKADLVILTDIYAARETNTIGISSKDLQSEIKKLGTDCEYFSSFDAVETFLLENCFHGDMLITMGAGDVVNIGENLLGE